MGSTEIVVYAAEWSKVYEFIAGLWKELGCIPNFNLGKHNDQVLNKFSGIVLSYRSTVSSLRLYFADSSCCELGLESG